MKCDNARAEAFSALSALRRCWVAIPALMVVTALAGCPMAETPSDILTRPGQWLLTLSEDGEGGVPAADWTWEFTDEGLVILRRFPDRALWSGMPYKWVDGKVVIDSPVEITSVADYSENENPEFDTLRPGDVFGHMEVTLRLTGRSAESTQTMAGSYVFTFTEEWGGETFSGTFEGQGFDMTKGY